ncbi:MAG: hypothetical protein AB7E95_06595 [Kiritimatiellales bacterium]
MLTIKGENPDCRKSFLDLCQLCGVKPEHLDNEFVSETETFLRQSSIENAEAAAVASSLVFAHSVTENILMDICRIGADIDPSSWTSKVAKKSITFEEVEKKTISDLKKELIDKYFIQLEKESMLKKLDVLLGVIQPSNIASSRMKQYDRERIVKIDRLRNECVHDGKFAVRIHNIKEHLDYLYETIRLFIDLFCDKYSIDKFYEKALGDLGLAGTTPIDKDEV